MSSSSKTVQKDGHNHQMLLSLFTTNNIVNEVNLLIELSLWYPGV